MMLVSHLTHELSYAAAQRRHLTLANTAPASALVSQRLLQLNLSTLPFAVEDYHENRRPEGHDRPYGHEQCGAGTSGLMERGIIAQPLNKKQRAGEAAN